MHSSRFLAPALAADSPLTVAEPPRSEACCEMEWPESWGSVPAIRLQPSAPFAGSSTETDRIINRWRPRIFDLVEQSISMAQDLCEISWNADDEPYPCCPFLKLLEPGSNDMRRFTDEACHILLQALTRDEIIEEAFWPDHRKPDARDLHEWMQRWATWLPDEEGQFRFWSIFLPCEALEALYRYVHALVHDYYLEILELHMEWEENRELEIAAGEGLPITGGTPPESIIYWHPRLVLDELEFTLTSDNAEQLRDWAYDAFLNWARRIPKEQKEALCMLGYEADQLCAVRRWDD